MYNIIIIEYGCLSCMNICIIINLLWPLLVFIIICFILKLRFPRLKSIRDIYMCMYTVIAYIIFGRIVGSAS